MAIECYSDLGIPNTCKATIPDSEFETMQENGWGFVEAPDAGAPSGLGMYYACPEHKDPAFG